MATDKALGQQADWRQRPLPPPLLRYAQADVHYLLCIADCLGQELLAAPLPWRHHHHRMAPQLLLLQWGQGQEGGQLERQGQEREREEEHQGGKQGQQRVQQQQEQQQQEQQQQQQQQQEQVLPSPKPLPPQQQPQAAPEVTPASLAAAMVPGSALAKAVHRSHAVSLACYSLPSPDAAVASAALGLMRQHLAAARRAGWAGWVEPLPAPPRHLVTPEDPRHLEILADCIHSLCSWRDGEARRYDDGLQCVLPDTVLLELAQAQPCTQQQLLNVLDRAGGCARTDAVLGSAGDSTSTNTGLATSNGGATRRRSGGPSSSTSSTTPPSSVCLFPQLLRQQSAQVAALLTEAAAGRLPWVCPELAELLHLAWGTRAGGGSSSKAMRKRADPEAFRQQLVRVWGFLLFLSLVPLTMVVKTHGYACPVVACSLLLLLLLSDVPGAAPAAGHAAGGSLRSQGGRVRQLPHAEHQRRAALPHRPQGKPRCWDQLGGCGARLGRVLCGGGQPVEHGGLTPP